MTVPLLYRKREFDSRFVSDLPSICSDVADVRLQKRRGKRHAPDTPNSDTATENLVKKPKVDKPLSESLSYTTRSRRCSFSSSTIREGSQELHCQSERRRDRRQATRQVVIEVVDLLPYIITLVRFPS